MKQRTARYVLDAFPLVVLFGRQKGWELVKAKLDDVNASGEHCLISSVNLGEVYYSIIRDHGKDLADSIIADISNSQIDIIYPTLEQTLLAGIFKSTGGLSYADCYAAALSKEYGIPVLTGDKEFAVVEQRGIQIEWLPSNR